MTQASNEKASPSYLQKTTGPPTQPGAYWFQGEVMTREVLVDVRPKNGEQTVRWPNQDVPVAKLNGSWRGRIPPSTGFAREGK
jgi:hypothetical protein